MTIPVVYSLLSPNALTALIAAKYDVEPPLRCELWQPAQSGGNDLYLITSNTTQYILRVYLCGSRSRQELETDMTLLQDAITAGLPVVQPIPGRDGNPLLVLNAPEGLRYAVLFAFAKGLPPGSAITEAQSYAYGHLTGQLHHFLDQQAPHRYEYGHFKTVSLLDQPLALILPYLSTPAQKTYLLRLVTRLKEHFDELPTFLPTYGICHNDLHKMNVLCTEDGQLTLIDFDCTSFGWRSYELAVFRWSTARPVDLGGLQPIHAEQVWLSFLKGYQSIRMLSASEGEAVSDFVVARHLWWLAIDLSKINQGVMAKGNWLNEAFFDRHFAVMKELEKL